MKTTRRFALALFRVFGCSLLFAAALLMPHETFADSETQSCSPIGAAFMVFISTLPQVQALRCGQFDPALGTLQSASFVVDSNLYATLGVANNENVVAGSAGDGVSVVVYVTGAPFGSPQINMGQFVLPEQTLAAGSQIEQMFVDPSVSTTLMTGASAPLVGTGNFALSTAELVTTTDEANGGVQPTFFGSVGLDGNAKITYNYTTGSTSTVPEPSSLAILSVGILALAGFAAKKFL
jgi:hypothetical protein